MKPSLRSAKGVSSPRYFDIEYKGLQHRIVLKRVATARRFILRVRASRGDVVLTMPPRSSSSAAQAFALRHADWVAERVAQLQRPMALIHNAVIPFRGVLHRLVRTPGLRSRAWTEPAVEGQPGPGVLCVGGAESTFTRIVLSFLREEARRDLTEAVARHAAEVRRPVASITLRDTKSRWGSCTARGSLNFSWRLILAPPFVLDYLAAHEVAHLVHMNHSDAFWTLTRRLAPQTSEAEQWLKLHGAALHHYG